MTYSPFEQRTRQTWRVRCEPVHQTLRLWAMCAITSKQHRSLERCAHGICNLRFKPYRKFSVEQVFLIYPRLVRQHEVFIAFNNSPPGIGSHAPLTSLRPFLPEAPIGLAKKIMTVYRRHIRLSKECKRAAPLCVGSTFPINIACRVIVDDTSAHQFVDLAERGR